jgi:peptide-methionine (S)-S-oxide reductase
MYENNLQRATFAAGCFWGVEEAFLKMKGVKSTRVGYTGGNFPDPSYEDVCTDITGHAEAIELEFEPNEISYRELIDFFWSIHNPTTMNRQGPDIGSQYRSTIFYHNPEQENIARKSKQQLDDSNSFQNKIVTEIVPAATFYQAENYHQKYYQKIGGGSCYHLK